MKLSALSTLEYPPYYQLYFSTMSPDTDLLQALESSFHDFETFFHTIPIEKYEFQYDKGKWTLKEIIQHLIDCERIFAYRALRFSRNDKTELSGFDENMYAQHAHAHSRQLDHLIQEFSCVRQSSVLLFQSLTKEQLCLSGIANNTSISVRALGFVILAHQYHHQKVYVERYLTF